MFLIDIVSHLFVRLLTCASTPYEQAEPSLVRALSRAFGLTFYLSGFLKFAQDMLGFVGPQLLSLLIVFVSDSSIPEWRGYALAFALLVSAELQSLILHQVPFVHVCSHVFNSPWVIFLCWSHS